MINPKYKKIYIQNNVQNNVLDNIGVVAATKLPSGKVAFGWSLTNKKDNFNHRQGIAIAIGRCFNGSNKRVPNKLQPAYDKMVKRAAAYFKA